MNYKIVRPDGEVLVTAVTARAIKLRLYAARNVSEHVTIIDREGGIVSEAELESLCEFEQRDDND